MLFLVFAFLAYMEVAPFIRDIRQRAALVPIEDGAELFANAFGRYPPSDANDMTGLPYCGAMKLVEALVGQDLQGFHPKSGFRADGLDPTTLVPLYTPDTLGVRHRAFPPAQNAYIFKLVDVFGKGNTGPFRDDILVICDIFERRRPSGKKTGMPVLYYRANPSGTRHDPNNPNDPNNIYDYRDNLALLNLGIPGDPDATHSLADPKRFYLNTRNDRIRETSRPYRADSYILISAGHDRLYGTADDICNFEWKYRER